MFQDAQQELKRLEEELLAQESPDEEETEQTDEDLPDAEALDALLAQTQRIETPEGGCIYRNYSNDYGNSLRNHASGYRAYNTDHTDTDMEAYSSHVYEEPKKGLSGLIATALLLIAGIFAVLCYLVLRFGGLL